MMSNSPSDRLLESFLPRMEKEGYTYRKTGQRFIKSFAYGTHECWLTFDGRGGLVSVEPAFFVRFAELEKQFKKALGYECSWSAGGTLLNLGGNPWKYWLFEEQYASLSPTERAGLESDVIHPPARIQGGVEFLMQAHTEFALPLFQKLETYKELAEYYQHYVRNGFVGRGYPSADKVIYLSLIIASFLGDDGEEVLEPLKRFENGFLGPTFDSSLQTVRQHIETMKVGKFS